MNIKIDVSKITKFGERLTSEYELQTMLMTLTQEIAKELHKAILTRTPILTGNLRKMWSAGDNLRFTVEPINNGYQVTLINIAQNVKGERYGIWVNDGHRTPSGNGWVMGRFFVEKSILQTTPQVEQIIMNELQKWWDSV